MFCIKYLASSAWVFILLISTVPGFGRPVIKNSSNDTLDIVERSDDELLVLEMRLDRHILSEGLIGYMHRGGVLLSLADVVDALEFAINVEPASGQATGWFLRQNRLFSLDIRRREAIIDGLVHSIDPALVELHRDGIYVDAALLSQWFPIELDIVLSQLMICVTSKEPLPLERRLEREQARSHLHQLDPDSTDYPKVYAPYSLWDRPFIDANTNIIQRSPETGGRETRYTGLINGDFLYMNSDLFFAGIDKDSLTDVRLTMGRSDPDENLLGPWHATSVHFGDVFSPQIPLISINRDGLGGEISNFPLGRPTEFDRTTLRGELPPGWEVELYRNEVLLDYQESRADGRYEFADVPLLYGLNVLNLIFYGPQGQKQEEMRRYHVGPGLVRPGKQYYRFAANRQDKYLLHTEQFARDEELIGQGRFIGEFERGISHTFSIAAAGVSLPFADKRRSYASLGVRASFLGMFSRLDAAKEIDGGTALQVSSQFNIGGHNIFAEHGRYFDFTSERARNESDPIISLTNFRLDGALSIWPLPRMPFSLTGQLERRDSGRIRADLLSRLSMYFRNISITHTLRETLMEGGWSPFSRRVDGIFLLSGQLRRTSIRAELSYDPPPNHEFRNISLTADYEIPQDITVILSTDRDLQNGRWMSYTIGLNRIFDAFLIGCEGRYQSKANYSIRLSVSFSLGWKSHSNNLYLSSRKIGNDGAASLSVFLDKNLNGVYDDDDEPLPGIVLRYGRQTTRPTDQNGMTYIPNLASYRPTDITVDIASLEDPFWMPAKEGVTVITRPGKSVFLQIPIILTGEIDGTVFLARDGSLKEASNVEVELIDRGGEIVQRTKTAFDGFYLFTQIPPGHYIVRVSPTQLERLNLEPPYRRRITIENNGPVISGVDFTIEDGE